MTAAWHRKSGALLAWMMVCVLATSCTASGVGRHWGFTPAGAFDVAQCAGACVEKLNVGADGERCTRFTRSMADICFSKVEPRGSIVLVRDPG